MFIKLIDYIEEEKVEIEDEKQQQPEEEEQRCSYCGEISHEIGTRCPHKPDNNNDEDESDLEDYV